ncbi:arrestin domain-containing protein 3-like [Helicoverpa armigera]|uniref:arrestin domain-containing protein 3-like n=1 Tax=Helicoverpa armigera TaxID=29058 RepID=UPI003082871B
MGVLCQILINRTDDGVFRSGQTVTGTLKYSIEKPTRYNSIDISFVGKGRCRWSEGSRKNRRTYSNQEEYFSAYQNLYTPKGDEMLKPGEFEYPFEFIVPYNIPSSFKDYTCTIEYKVIVKFAKRKLFSSGDTFETEIPICGCVSSSLQEPLLFGLRKTLTSFKSNSKVRVNAEIDKVTVAPGEHFNLRLTIFNDSNVSVMVKTELLTFFTYVSSIGHKKVVMQPIEATKSNSTKIKAGSKTELVCNVPTLTSMYSIQHTKILIGQYKVRVMVKLPFPHVNAAVAIPVEIGEIGNSPQIVVPPDLENPSTSYSLTEKNYKFKHEENDDDFENYNGKIKSEYESEKGDENEESDEDGKTYYEEFDLEYTNDEDLIKYVDKLKLKNTSEENNNEFEDDDTEIELADDREKHYVKLPK